MKRTRTISPLSDLVHHQLSSYALAAGAAGVGALALVQPAEAKIIYTKTNVNVFNTQGYPLDLNNDGTTDFWFMGRTFFSDDCVSSTALNIDHASQRNKIRQGAGGAAALPAGVAVGPKGSFSGSLLMGRLLHPCGGTYPYGPWEGRGKGVTHRYLGLRFVIRGKIHYGWARLNFPDPTGATMTGYAYETIPNKPIITGKTKGPDVIPVLPATSPGTLGKLALGRK